MALRYQIINQNSIDYLQTLPDNSIDSVVCDPPYGINFLGKAWDSNTGEAGVYAECLRVLKPGGHLLAFSAARTYHHLAMTVERVGFEIRDQIMWIYSSGFPKSQDVGRSIERSENKVKNKATKNKLANNNKIYFPDPENTPVESAGQLTAPRCVLCHSSTGPIHKKCSREDCIRPWEQPKADNKWSGWGTALKPAHEPIVVARKPIKLSVAKNVQKWGVGALNIDATRVPFDGDKPKPASFKNGISYRQHTEELYEKQVEHTTERIQEYNDGGRFPSNVIGEITDYQKFFYCPKVSRKERHLGHDMPEAMFGDKEGAYDDNGQRYAVELDKRTGNVGNNHPTVKPIALMRYLIKLVTPPGGHVLDPFNGSGSTGCAAVELDYQYTGIDLDANYCEISRKRIEAWYAETHKSTYTDLFEEE